MSINSPNVNALYHTEIKTSLTKIAQKQNIEIEVHANSEPEIHMFGSIHAIESARVEILVLLDQLVRFYLDRFFFSVKNFLYTNFQKGKLDIHL